MTCSGEDSGVCNCGDKGFIFMCLLLTLLGAFVLDFLDGPVFAQLSK